jgi:hypothetical protein
MPRSPRRRIRLVTVIGELPVLRRPGWARNTSADLAPATGARTTRFCRPRPVFARRPRRHVHIRRSTGEDRSNIVRLRASIAQNRPATATARPTLPRPPHPVPTFVTMANAPRERRDGGDKPVIWARSEAEYFCEGDWTGRNRLIRFRKLVSGRNAS